MSEALPDEPAGQALDAALARLPRELRPARDLWPQIEPQLSAPVPATRPWLWGVAASALLGSVLVAALAPGTRHPRPAAAHSAAQLSLGARSQPTDQSGIAQVRGDLRRAFDARLPLLAPETRSAIVKSLATIEQAHEELRRALERDPASPMLRELLEATWQQEFDLYVDVVRGTEPLQQRNST